MAANSPLGTLGSVAFLLATTMNQGNHDKNHKLRIIGQTVKYILHNADAAGMLQHIN